MDYKRSEDCEITISVADLFRLFKKNVALIVIVSLIFMAGAGAYSVFCVDKTYSSTAKIMVYKIDPVYAGEKTEIAVNPMDCIELLTGTAIMNEAAKSLDANVSPSDLESQISAENPTSTNVISITSQNRDSSQSKRALEAVLSASIKVIP